MNRLAILFRAWLPLALTTCLAKPRWKTPKRLHLLQRLQLVIKSVRCHFCRSFLPSNFHCSCPPPSNTLSRDTLKKKKAALYITTISAHFGCIPKVYAVTFASKTLSSKDFTVILVPSLITLLFSLFLLRTCLFLTRIWDRTLLRSPCKPSEFLPDVRCVVDRQSSKALCSPIRDFPEWII